MKIQSLLLLTALSFTVFVNQNAFSQAMQPADQGISMHNYKQVNKAAEARKNRTEGIFIPNNRIRMVSINSTYRKNINQDYTPKYKTASYAIVIPVKHKKETVRINPLTSGRNYKTGNSGHLTSAQKNSLATTM